MNHELRQRLERFGRFLMLDPTNVVLLRDYAQLALLLGEWEAGRTALERLTAQVDEARPSDHAALVGAWRRLGNLETALRCAVVASHQWPSDAALALEHAKCLFADGDPSSALIRLLTAEDVRLRAERCALQVRLLHHLGRLDEALNVADEFRAACDHNVDVEASTLPILVDLSRLPEAVQRAGLLLELANEQPPPYETYEPMALAALDSQRPLEALEWVAQALSERSDDGRIWLAKGLAHLQVRDESLAADALARSAGLMPDHAGIQLALGWAALLRKNLDGARTAFIAGIDASPAFSEGHGSLAVVHVLQGNFDEAKVAIRKALLLDRNCASAQFARLMLVQSPQTDISQLADRVLSRARGKQQMAPGH